MYKKAAPRVRLGAEAVSVSKVERRVCGFFVRAFVAYTILKQGGTNMKKTVKRVLSACCAVATMAVALPCVPLMGVSAASTGWTIAENVECKNLTGECTVYVGNSTTNALSIDIPDEYSMSDLQLYVQVELDEKAAEFLNKSNMCMELDNMPTFDSREISMQVGDWKAGLNEKRLSLSAFGYYTKANMNYEPFDIHDTIQHFRIHTNAKKAQDVVGQAVNITFKRIAIVTTPSGMNFKDTRSVGNNGDTYTDDTYLQTENAVTSGVSSVEATVKMDAVAQDKTAYWVISDGTKATAMTGWGNDQNRTYETWTAQDGVFGPADGTTWEKQTGKTLNDKGNWTFTATRTFTALDIPSGYSVDNLQFEMWLYVSDADALLADTTGNSDTRFYINSSIPSGNWDTGNRLTKRGLISTPYVDLEDGWNHIVLPLSWLDAGGDFDCRNICGVRISGWSVHGLDVVMGYTDVRISVRDTAEYSNEYVLEELPLNSSSKITVENSANPGVVKAGTVYKELTEKGNYVSKNHFTDPVDPKGITADTAAIAFNLYVSDLDKFYSNTKDTNTLEVGTITQEQLDASGHSYVWDKYERQPVFHNLVEVKQGWNRVVIPLSKTGEGNGTYKFDAETLAITRFRLYGAYGISAISELKLIEWHGIDAAEEDMETIGTVTTSVGSATASKLQTANAEHIVPAGAVVYTHTVPVQTTGLWGVGGAISTAIDAETDDLTKLALATYIYWPEGCTIEAGEPGNFELTSGGIYDKQEINWNLAKANLKTGWNRVVLKFSDYSQMIKDGNKAFDPSNINYFRFTGLKNTGTAAATFKMTAPVILRTADETAGSESTWTVVQSTADWDGVYTVLATENEDFALVVTAEGYPAVIRKNADNTYTQVTVNRYLFTGEYAALSLVSADGKGTLYVNGEKVAESELLYSPAAANQKWNIGARHSGANVFDGVIGNVRLWSKALDAATVKANQIDLTMSATTGLTAGTEGLVDAWILRANITHVLETITGDNGGKLVYKGTRAAQWIDDKTHEELVEMLGEDYYTIAVMPDPQNITVEKGMTWWNNLCTYLGQAIDTENIQHIINLGDSTWAADEAAFKRALSGYEKFADKVSWSAATGNHDYPGWMGLGSNGKQYRDTTNYNNLMGYNYLMSTGSADTFVDYYRDDSDYQTEGIGVENSYYAFTVGQTNWLILQLEFFPRKSVLNWAESVLKKYPNHNVIISTHAYLGNDADYQVNNYSYFGVEKENGDFLGTTENIYKQLVEPYSNVKFVVGGHNDNSGAGKHGISSKNITRADGTTVYQYMINGQYLDTNDSTDYNYYDDRMLGMVSLFRFSADGTKCYVNWYCPTDDKCYEPHGTQENWDEAACAGTTKVRPSNFLITNLNLTQSGETAFAVGTAQATVSDNIDMTFGIDADTLTKLNLGEGTVYKAKVWFNGNEYTLSNTATFGAAFTFTDIRPDQLNTVITVQPYAENGGNTVYGVTKTFTLREYCYDLIETYADDTAVVEMAKALLNYGTAAQVYTKNYTYTSEKVNAFLSDTDKQLGLSGLTLNASQKLDATANNAATAKWNAGTLTLTNAVNIRVVFTTTATDTTGWYVKAEKSVGTNKYATAKLNLSKDGDRYVVTYTDLNPSEWNLAEVTFTVCNADNEAVSTTLGYSVAAYATAQKDGAEGLGDLVKTMMIYGDKVSVYVNQKED